MIPGLPTDLPIEGELFWFAYIGLALGVFMLFTGLVSLVNRREQQGEAKSRRMRMIARGRSTAEILAVLKPEQTDSAWSRVPVFGTLRGDLTKAGILMRPPAFLMLCAVAALILSVFGYPFLGAGRSVLLGIVIGIVLPLIVVRVRCKARIDKMIRQMPDALELMARGLRVGHPLNTSIKSVAEELEDPIATEFGIIFDQVTFGDDLADAFAEFAERYPVEDVQYLSASVGIQHGTGGDLSSILDTLARVIRDRLTMRRRIKAISSEGRLSAWFLSALPPLIFVSTSIMTPGYYTDLADDPLYLPMMGAIAGLTVLNALILRKLVTFRV